MQPPFPRRLLTLGPGGLHRNYINSIIFLKRGTNYSAGRASENGIWDPSATPQDPDMLVHALEGPVAQNFRPADVLYHYYRVGGPANLDSSFRHRLSLQLLTT